MEGIQQEKLTIIAVQLNDVGHPGLGHWLYK